MLDIQTLYMVSNERYEERLRQAVIDQRNEEKVRQVLRRFVLWLTRRGASQLSAQRAGVTNQPMIPQVH
jgi:hypothetical protein